MRKAELKQSRQYREMWASNKAFLTVPMQWCVRFDLTPTELMILRHIQYLTSNGNDNCFSGSVKALCAITNSTLPTARKALDNLHDKGWIRKSLRPRRLPNEREVDWVCYRATIPYETTTNDRGIESELRSELTRRTSVNYTKPFANK